MKSVKHNNSNIMSKTQKIEFNWTCFCARTPPNRTKVKTQKNELSVKINSKFKFIIIKELIVEQAAGVRRA